MMGRSKSQTITIAVAIATLTSNTLSSILFHQLPDDPYHLASNFGWYLHFANVLSVFGLIGALRQHAPSIAIFSNYLLLDTILCSIPRFLLLALLQPLTSSLCSPPYDPLTLSPSIETIQISLPTEQEYAAPSYGLENQIGQLTESWTQDGCVRIVWLAQLTLGAGVLAATLLQFVGALCVREYSRQLRRRDMRGEKKFEIVNEQKGEGRMEKC